MEDVDLLQQRLFESILLNSDSNVSDIQHQENKILEENDLHLHQMILNIEYWFDGPIGFSLASIGLVFNTIAIYTLGKQVCHKTFHSLMMLLSCWDFGLLFFSQFLFALPELSESYKNGLFLQLVPYLIPMAQICLSGSCFTTVALTVERYIAVCTPFFRMKYNIKSMAYVLPILIFAPVYNIPRFFEFESKPGGPNENTTLSCADGDETFEVEDQFLIELVIKLNESIWNKWGIQCIQNNPYPVDSLVLTETRKDKLYISIYLNFVNYIVNFAFPILTLVVLNYQIYKELRKNLRHEVLLGRRHQNEQKKNALRKRDIRLTRISIIIVVIFMVCHIPRFIMNVIEMVYGDLSKPLHLLMLSISHLMLIINSTVNYIIYFGSGWKLRQTEKNAQKNRMQQLELRPLNKTDQLVAMENLHLSLSKSSIKTVTTKLSLSWA